VRGDAPAFPVADRLGTDGLSADGLLEQLFQEFPGYGIGRVADFETEGQIER
jgi:hypothetical protein